MAVEEWTDAERFLLATHDAMMEHPRDLASPTEVGLRLGFDYDRVVEVLDELEAAHLVRRAGSRRVLSDSRMLVTEDGFRVIRELERRRSGRR
jgi:DNA-binding MarR family transcriptional regulator